MKSLTLRLAAIWFLFLAMACAAHSQISAMKLHVGREGLCVTEGVIEKGPKDRLLVNTTKMRAYVNAQTSQAIQAHFTYVGPTAEESRLGSGQIRRQFGLKLRAQDACNLVYAMWRFEPESKIVVSIKKNPAQTRSSECGNRGYQNIKPRHTPAVPVSRPGDTHNFGAEIEGEELHVFVDNSEVWEGNLGAEALGLQGPVGIRSDNVRLALDLQTGAYAGGHPEPAPSCKQGPDASD